MGASNCPETPRQKMIGMMYLVLTAMLALNVSKDILDAFVVVDQTLITSTTNSEATIESDYGFLLQQKAILGEEKVKDALAEADELKKASDELVYYIEDLKKELLIFSDGGDLNKEGLPKTAKDIQSKDNYSSPSNFFINQGKAKELKEKITQYRNLILDFAPKEYREVYAKNIGLDVDAKYESKDGLKEDWETHNFNHVILIACVTLLNKTVGEVRNAESIMLKQIIAGISANDFKFDKISGRTIPKSGMVFQGGSYESDIIVAAFDSKQDLEIYYKMGVDSLPISQMESATKLVGENGVAQLKLNASSVGDQRYAGFIKIKTPTGTDAFYHFNDRYTVVQPTATVAAEKMNVLYSGIDNPLSVAAPVAPEKLRVSIPGATIKGSSGKWVASVPANQIGKTVTATISADLGNGKVQQMGTSAFRVKRVPDPTAYVGADILGGRRSKQELLANPFITAQMGADFAYDLKWTINSYRVIFVVKGVDDPPVAVSGNRFSEELKNKINRAGAGTIIYFTDIKATSSAGQRTLNEISIRIR